MWNKIPVLLKLPILAFIPVLIYFYFSPTSEYKWAFVIAVWIGSWIWEIVTLRITGMDIFNSNPKP
jgi:hypothetical protein